MIDPKLSMTLPTPTRSESLAARLRELPEAQLDLLTRDAAEFGDSFDNGFDNAFDNAFDNS